MLGAFAATGLPRLLAGGQGTSWAVDDLVLKPGGGPVHDWMAVTLRDISPVGFRLATPVRTLHGTWCFEGWVATRWVDGVVPDYTRQSTWMRIIDAGRAFHRAVGHLRRPDCLDARTDPWAVADRVAWGELDVRSPPELERLVHRLQRAVEPLGAPQIVHGDLAGNVVLSPTLPPAVLDVSPYWRPAEYAEGIVVADALLWHGAHASLHELVGVSVPAVARGLLFRIQTADRAGSAGRAGADGRAQRYEHAVDALGL